jgi:hypothetical protein
MGARIGAARSASAEGSNQISNELSPIQRPEIGD